MAHPCAGFRPCASLVPAGRTHNITHDIMRPFLPADCSKMTRDLQKSPVSRVEQHEIGGTSEFGNKKTVSWRIQQQIPQVPTVVETAPSQVRGGFFVRYTQAGLLTQTFKRTSPSSRNKHPSDIAERHSANTATALCGILTRLPFSPITIG